MNAVMHPEGLPQLKIRPEHLALAAIVYVRQSTRGQVLEHTESTRLQYALAGRAVALGWARSQVIVIDDDLGVSAAVPDSREGFARLVTEVTMGRAGVVLGIEMSRLARTGKDWHHLLELCSLSGTLLADPDAVLRSGVLQRPPAAGAEGDDERGRDFPDPAADAGREAGQGRARRADPAAPGRIRAPPVRRGRLRPRRAGAGRRPPYLQDLPAAGDPQRRAALSRRARDPASGPRALGAGEGRPGMAAPDPGDAAEHAAQPCLRGLLRLRPPSGRSPQEDPRPPGHRESGEARRRVAGHAAGQASRLHLRGRVPREPRQAGRQPADRGVPGRSPERGGAAVRAAALRPVRRAPHGGQLPRPVRPRRLRLHLRVLPGELRDRRPLPAHCRPRAR